MWAAARSNNQHGKEPRERWFKARFENALRSGHNHLVTSNDNPRDQRQHDAFIEIEITRVSNAKRVKLERMLSLFAQYRSWLGNPESGLFPSTLGTTDEAHVSEARAATKER